MISLEEEWEFNVAGVYNYKKPGPLKYYFDYILHNHNNISGDILEAGVFKGRSLLGIALMLRELGSDKKVYGFDTFSGFPPIYHKNDDIDKFNYLFSQGKITKEHLDKVKKNIELRSVSNSKKPNAENISLSGDFSNNSKEVLDSKIQLLGLDNVVLVPGPFDETMVNDKFANLELMAAILDCDLYESYHTSLNFIWPKLAYKGYLYLDEYYSLKFPGAMIATDEFFSDKIDKPHCNQIETGDFERWAVIKNK